MNDLSRLANLAEILSAIIVVGGVFFALMQMRQIRQQRRELAAIELFRFFGNPQFAPAYKHVLLLPPGLGAAALRERHPDSENAAMLIATTMENIGVMMFKRIVPFLVVNSLVGTSAVMLWHKLEPWVKDLREELDQPSAFEWFQWLAEKLEEYARDDHAPAYEAFRNWKPTRLTNEI